MKIITMIKDFFVRYKMILGNGLYFVGLIYFFDKGYAMRYLLISGLLMTIIFHKQLWAVMNHGGKMYEKFSRKQGDRLYNITERVRKK